MLDINQQIIILTSYFLKCYFLKVEVACYLVMIQRDTYIYLSLLLFYLRLSTSDTEKVFNKNSFPKLFLNFDMNLGFITFL